MLDWTYIKQQWPKKEVPYFPIKGILQAAVLVPFIKRKGEFHLLFQKRAPHIRQGGEVSFPGGAIEPTDSSIEYAALRESYEEIQLPINQVDVFGTLRPHFIPTGVVVYPFLGEVHTPIQLLQASKDEVDYLFTVPLSFFLTHKAEVYPINPSFVSNVQAQQTGKEEILFPAKAYQLDAHYEKPWQSFSRTLYQYKYNGEVIWGLTADIILTLVETFKTVEEKKMTEKKMSDKEKMLALIKQKQGGGRSKKMAEPKNDRKHMRKGPKIFNK